MEITNIYQIVDILRQVLEFLGLVTILGIVGFITAYYAIPPNLAVSEIQKRSEYNFESRIIIENIGRWPAYNVVVDVSNMKLVMNGMTMNAEATDCGVPTSKLSYNEKMELPVCPHVEVPAGMQLTSCKYKMILKYKFRFVFININKSKEWIVELRETPKDFHWQITKR